MSEINTDRQPGGERIKWLDAARGIGILLVVIGHVERGIVSAGIATGDVWATFDTSLYTFHMPLFMLLAGLNVPGSLRRGRAHFVRDKLQSVAYPYLLWSLIQGATLVLLSSFTNGSAAWSDLALIGWKPMSQFWFLHALFLYLLLVAAVGLQKIMLLPIALVALAACPFLEGNSVAQRLGFFLIFFVTGVLLSEPIREWRPQAPFAWLVLLSGFWIGGLWLLPVKDEPYISLWALPCALLGSFAVMLLAQTLRGTIEAFFVKLGVWSMSIYVMHILAASGTRIAMTKANIHAPAIVYLIIAAIVGIALPIVAHIILDRLGLLPVFGLGKKHKPLPNVSSERANADLARSTE